MASHVPDLPRAAILNPVKFELAAVHNYVCRRLLKVFELGTQGKIPAKQQRSYDLGVKVGLAILERTAPINQPQVALLAPNSVVLNLSPVAAQSAAGLELPPSGLELHLGGGNGHGAGTRGLRDAG